MEVSISGGLTFEHKAYPGLRPTLNSYMAADAFALSKIAKKAGGDDVAEKYEKHGRKIVDRMIELLWDGSFFKAIHYAWPFATTQTLVAVHRTYGCTGIQRIFDLYAGDIVQPDIIITENTFTMVLPNRNLAPTIRRNVNSMSVTGQEHFSH